MQNGEVLLTPVGSQRARDIVRRHRLAERLFKDTFSIEDSEAPKTCPHGNPIPPGECCNGKSRS
jgi:DtxR family Mn-dependent transcriptional regulator